MQEICPICGSKELKVLDKVEKKFKCLSCDETFNLTPHVIKTVERVVTKVKENDSRELTAKEIYNLNIDSIVEVSCIFGDESASGTGFYVSTDGYLITNAHVVIDINGKNSKLCESVYVSKSRSTDYLEADVVYLDAKDDLALLKVKDKIDCQPVKFAKTLDIGEKLTVIGNSEGQGLLVLDGIVGDVNREYKNTKAFIFNALVTHGCSGGPIFNSRGELCGVTVGGSKTNAGMNYGILVEKVEELISKYKSK